MNSLIDTGKFEHRDGECLGVVGAAVELVQATLFLPDLAFHLRSAGQGDEISCSRVYVVPFSAASFACRRAFNLVVFSSVWTGAPFALTGCFVTAANSASARVRCFEVSDIGYPLVTGWGAGRRALSVA